jgi:hypothetical protein
MVWNFIVKRSVRIPTVSHGRIFLMRRRLMSDEDAFDMDLMELYGLKIVGC